jgi:hypothetical protein
MTTTRRKAVEVGGHPYVEAPKNRKRRKTICPCRTPAGYPLVGKLAARVEATRTEQEAGTNPLGLIFPSPTGKYWAVIQFSRNILKRAYIAAGWRDADANGTWTWHSLRRVFCTTALFTWQAVQVTWYDNVNWRLDLRPSRVSRADGRADRRAIGASAKPVP